MMLLERILSQCPRWEYEVALLQGHLTESAGEDVSVSLIFINKEKEIQIILWESENSLISQMLPDLPV